MVDKSTLNNLANIKKVFFDIGLFILRRRVFCVLLGLKTSKTSKKSYCFYCKKSKTNLSRHFILQHAEEDDVKTMVEEPSQREDILVKLRHLGNHLHNNRVMRKGRGELAVVYRQKKPGLTAHQYVPCPHCFGWFTAGTLYKHGKLCRFNKRKEQKGVFYLQNGKKLKATPLKTSDRLSDILQGLSNDAVSDVVKADRLLCELGERLTVKHGHDSNRHGYVRSTLRTLARLLIQIRKADEELSTFEKTIHPKNFSVILEACRKLSGFDSKSNAYETPSLALKIGNFYTQLIDVKYSIAIERSDDVIAKQCQELKKLFEIRWTKEFTSNAFRTFTEKRKNTISLVPLTEDLITFTNFLKKQIAESLDALKGTPSCKASYSQLQKALLAQIILFNRRRSGEVSRLKLDEYNKNTGGTQTISEQDLNLSEIEKKCASTFSRFELTGKRGRIVPVLLTSQMKAAADMLLSCRSLVGISAENPHFFATRIGSNGYIRGTDCMRQLSEACGAKRPEAIRSTKLRKHVATMTQLLNFSENQLDILADFMGHDIAVHRKFYRLPDEVIQVAKVSKFLQVLEQGKLANFQGKTLDDIEIQQEELESKKKTFFSNYILNESIIFCGYINN